MSGPQLLTPPGGELIYDHTNKDGELFLLDRSLEGCICLRFDRTVTGERARVDLDGKPVPVVLRDFPGMTVLGVDLRRVLNDYGKKALLTVSGFRSFEGEEMEPVTLPVSTPEREAPRPEYAAHEAVALQAAEEGIVLLKNEGGLLPLPEGTKLNFFGKGIWSFRCSATGAGKINPRYMVDLTEALAREPRVRANGELLDFYRCLEDRVPDEVCMARVRAFSDLAIFVLTRPTGENVDNSTAPGEFDLSAEEETLLGTLRTHFSKLLVILNTGYPVAMGLVEKYKVDAVLYCGFGGMLGGKALLNVLLGRVNPSGRLPDTWVNDYAELPTAANFYDAYRSGKRLDGNAPQWLDTVYAEDIFLGYRYFSSFDKPMACPFGFGLSNHHMLWPWNFSNPDTTHICLQVKNVDDSSRWISRYHKPLMVDECRYEGNIDWEWGNISAFELVDRFWKVVCQGGYASHGETYLDENDVLWWAKGGVLKGQSPRRIAFLKSVVESLPGPLSSSDSDPTPEKLAQNPPDFLQKYPRELTPEQRLAVWMDGKRYAAQFEEKAYLVYYSRHTVAWGELRLPEDGIYRVERLDAWEMTRTVMDNAAHGHIRVPMPGKEGMALLAVKLK